MPTDIHGFIVNNPGEDPPWDQTEFDMHDDIIHTLVADTCTGTVEATDGHRHPRLYNPDGDVALLEGNATDDVDVYQYLNFGNGDKGANFGLDAYSNPIIEVHYDDDANRFEIDTDVSDQNVQTGFILKTGYSGDIILEPAASGGSRSVCIGVGVVGGDVNPKYPAKNNAIAFYVEGSNLKVYFTDGSGNMTVGTVCALS